MKYWEILADRLHALEKDAIAAKGANGNATRDGIRYVVESDKL